MKLFFTGSNTCDEATLKRLLLVASELVFTDNPSVVFGNWGTVGVPSPFRRLDTSKEAVRITVCAAAERGSPLYKHYAEADLTNPEFIRICLAALRSASFSGKFLQADQMYGENLTGQNVLDALTQDPSLTPLPLHEDREPILYGVSSEDARRVSLRTVLVSASIAVTSALLAANEADAMPASDDLNLLKLLSLRMSSDKYLGQTAPNAWLLGVEFAKAVIPDKALERLSLSDIATYRRKTKDIYDAWTSELNLMAAKIDELSLEEVQDKLPKLIVTELRPREILYKSELASARDNLFADAIRGINDWKMPTLSLVSWATLGHGAALVAFASSIVAKPIVDFVTGVRATRRKHPVSYLVRLTDDDSN